MYSRYSLIHEKKFQPLEIKNVLNFTKNIYKNLIGSIIFNDKKYPGDDLLLWSGTRISSLNTPIQHWTKIPTWWNGTLKGNKIYRFGEKNILCLFTNDNVVYVENPEELTKNPEIYEWVYHGHRYKINIQKWIAFLIKKWTIGVWNCKM